ncbi:hypothetical protein STENM223S_10749 [Streptomyces tendae]
MVPAACVLVEELPLTANGKLDVRALPAPDFTAAAGSARPATPEQRLVCGLFEEVLRLPEDTVGVEDDFFELGGQSLLATRLLARLRAETGTDVPISALFDAPRPAALAARLASAPDGGPRTPALTAAERPGRVPLSFAQERMWSWTGWARRPRRTTSRSSSRCGTRPTRRRCVPPSATWPTGTRACARCSCGTAAPRTSGSRRPESCVPCCGSWTALPGRRPRRWRRPCGTAST